MSFTEDFFTNPDGLRLQYRDYAPIGEVTGMPVLCLHGLTRNVKDFEDVAPRIAALGRRVLVVSQRGRARSDYDPQHERYQPLVYAADMAAFLDQMEIPSAVFVGTSMGGLMTIALNATRPDLVAAAVLNDIGTELAEEGLNRIRENTSSPEPVKTWAEAIERTKASNLTEFPERDGDEAYWEAFASRLWVKREDGLFHLDYDPAITAAIGDTDAPTLWDYWMPAFEGKPVLLIRGGLTDLLTPQTAAEMKARKPDMDFAEIPNIGHAPMLTEPESWAALEGFIKRVD